jgi:hypothetical protein
MQDADDEYRNVLQAIKDKMLACLETFVRVAHNGVHVTNVRVGPDRTQGAIEQVAIGLQSRSPHVGSVWSNMSSKSSCASAASSSR